MIGAHGHCSRLYSSLGLMVLVLLPRVVQVVDLGKRA